ncbi:hypothetical protein ACSDR0_15320 [Streptosporangium sp. G11]|uniref:hypothetical protein n=1 Tax=Streptosporangium sp. G11 TaxID=3436926 RepID=UPI003EBBAC5A
MTGQRSQGRRTATERQAAKLLGITVEDDPGDVEESEPTVTELQARRLLRGRRGDGPPAAA